mmetsp:Transcript_31706/g.82743  ORF Transcript_31706/g.82743 Transcript_31706/m.82743 type:complete len:90 (-) Transcript_31706:1075-1344(-)
MRSRWRGFFSRKYIHHLQARRKFVDSVVAKANCVDILLQIVALTRKFIRMLHFSKNFEIIMSKSSRKARGYEKRKRSRNSKKYCLIYTI